MGLSAPVEGQGILARTISHVSDQCPSLWCGTLLEESLQQPATTSLPQSEMLFFSNAMKLLLPLINEGDQETIQHIDI